MFRPSSVSGTETDKVQNNPYTRSMPTDDAATPSITQIYRDRSVTFESLVAEDEGTRKVMAQAERAARSDASILIMGESGTGKNLIAQAIHNASPRAGKPFVSANCAAFAESLLETELFGHEKGSFTGADRIRKGVFELADGGTLFLDEIGELSKNAQAKILRAVEYKEFERVGGEETLRSDIRILFATNRDLEEAVRNDEFREDLFYRVNEIRIEIPPLRKRKKDVPKLVDRYLQECNATFGYNIEGVTDEAMKALLAFDWPGNARRLRAVIKRACAITDAKQLTVEDLDLSEPLRKTVQADPPESLDDWTLATIERRHIQRVLQHAQGNKSEAARILGIARTTLDRKLASYDLE